MAINYIDATTEEVDAALNRSWQAFRQYRRLSWKERAAFLYAIAGEMEERASELIDVAHKETHLGKGRLKVELGRTMFQLTSYGKACEQGSWMDIRIEEGSGTKPDLRKMLVPLGPVVVFGASNFPFAYSTAGGDTACALAAGCTVVLKAHPAHAATSELVAEAVHAAAQYCGLPPAVFIHIHGASFEVGQSLVQHPLTKAVGFTGSYEGGMALFSWANSRPVPIPVFAEMGSVNPVFLLQQKLKEDGAAVAGIYASSITQGAGQFCTNPGLLVAIEDDALDKFKKILAEKIAAVQPVKMLHAAIAKNFHQKRERVLSQEGVSTTAVTNFDAQEDESVPSLAEVDAQTFLQNQLLQQEVFGPFSLLVKCKNAGEMLRVAQSLQGQLTANIIATEDEARSNPDLIEALQDICGRFVFNGVPTGVEVSIAMHHGGPYPATTDSRFTAVGADGIRRFARPVCYQNWPQALLPAELQK